MYFIAAEFPKNETKSMIIKSLNLVINTYHGRGFRNNGTVGLRQEQKNMSHR